MGVDRLRILLVGPHTDRYEESSIGGTTILFADLCGRLSLRDDVAANVLSTLGVKGAGARGLWRFVRLILEIVRGTRSCDVITLHAVTGGLYTLAPIVAVLARLFRKPCVLRKFGGTEFGGNTGVRLALAKWAIRRFDLYLVETQELVQQGKLAGLENVRWYSNSRPMPDEATDPMLHAATEADRRSSECTKFIFLGPIETGKGVPELVDAADQLPDDITVDVYGTLDFDILSEFFSGRRALFLGPVAPEDVQATLANYDAFVLPSHHPREGYPGVVLEAYAAGLPVIATRWKSLPEIVDETSGILIEPYSVEAIRRAILALRNDGDLYRRLRSGVREKRRSFSSEAWADRFVSYCREIAA